MGCTQCLGVIPFSSVLASAFFIMSYDSHLSGHSEASKQLDLERGRLNHLEQTIELSAQMELLYLHYPIW